MVEVHAFAVEWFDANASLVRKYRLNYFGDGTVELLNPERTKTILKRIPLNTITLGMLYIGSAVTIFSRQYHIVGYADEGTRKKFESDNGKAFCVVSGAAMKEKGRILGSIRKGGFVISNLKTVNTPDGDTILAVLAVSDRFGTNEAVTKFREMANTWGYEEDNIFCSGDAAAVIEHTEIYFGENCLPNSSVVNQEATLCLIKPHIIQEGNLGAVISQIEGDFSVAAMQMFYLDRECAVEFFDVYRGVLPQYGEIVQHLIDGPVVALQLVGENVVENFREFAGPINVEVAGILRPKTLRAVWGHDFAKNAVHATDLEEDGGLECKYFFDILAHI